jgi:adenylate cyclase
MNAHDRPGIASRSRSERASTTTSVLAIIEWLGGNECHDLDDAGLIAGLGRRLSDAGLPLDRFSVHFRTLHSAIAGRTIAWAPDEPVEVYEAGHAAAASMAFRESPVRGVMDAKEHLIVRAGDPSFSSWNEVDLFKGRGLREFLIAPLNVGEGPVSIAVFGTLRPSGFGLMDHAVLERVLPLLRTVFELRTLRRLELPLLDSFVGVRTAERVLAATLLHHGAESVQAALMLVKLREVAGSSDGVQDFDLALLEASIGIITFAISGHGGFVLSIGADSIFAIFPQEAEAACTAALMAAKTIVGNVDNEDASSRPLPDVILHYGKVTYGRLDTTLGHRLVMAGRDFDHLKELGKDAETKGIVLSRYFSDLIRTSQL